MASTASILDIFEDGSGLELIQLDSSLATELNGNLVKDGGGTVSYESGVFSDAIKITGDYEVQGLQSFPFTNELQGDATISLWYKVNALTQEDLGIFTFNNASFGGCGLYLDSSDNIVYSEGNWNNILLEPATLSTWIHVAIVWDWTSQVIKLYLDGVESGSIAYTTNREVSDSFDALRIGNHPYTWYANCSVDQIRLISKAVSTEEIALLMSEERSQVKTTFNQSSTIEPYTANVFEQTSIVENVTVNIFEQSSTVESVIVNIFEQSSYLNKGAKSIFYQSSTVSNIKNKTIFNQVQTVEEPRQSIMIRRVN